MCVRIPKVLSVVPLPVRIGCVLAWLVCLPGLAPYVDQTSLAGLPLEQEGESFALGGNVAALDADGDGDLDLILTAGFPGIQYFRNDSVPGSPSFVEGTEEVGLDSLVEAAMGLAVGDFNGDSLPDLFVATKSMDHLFIAQADGSFVDESEWRLPGVSRFSNGATVADFDLDGDADIHIARYVSKVNWPFHRGGRDGWLVNDGSGVFTDRIDAMGAANDGMALTSAFVDIDEDGDLDLLVANDFGPLSKASRAFRNDGPDPTGTWQFTDVGESSGLGVRVYGMGIAVLDVNADGHQDIHLTSIGRDVLLAGQGDGTYVDVTEAAGIAAIYNGTGHHVKWAPVVHDLDGDGRDDLYVRVGHIGSDWFITNSASQQDLPWLFAAEGKAQWGDVLGFPDTSEQGRGAIALDVDGDGVVDLVLGSADDEELRLLMGSPPVSDVHVRLHSSVSATPAGTRIQAGCDAKTHERVQLAGGLFASAAPLDHAWISFPAECTGSGFVDVIWPSGVRQQQSGVLTGDEVVFTEPEWVAVIPTVLPLGSEETFTVQIQPIDPSGGWTGPGHDVLVETMGGVAQVAVDLGDGTYLAEFSPGDEVGEAHLTIRVDGIPLQPHPALRVVAPTSVKMAIYPAHVTETLQTAVHVWTPPGTVAGLYPVGAEVVKVTAIALNHVRVVIAAPLGTETLALTPTQDGALVGAPQLHAVGSLFDAAQSLVDVEKPFVSESGEASVMVIRVRLHDANNRLSTADSLLAEVEIDGVKMFEEIPSPFAGSVTVMCPLDVSMIGSFAQIRINGETLGEPIEIRGYASAGDLATHVDAEASNVGTSFGTCRADGADLLAVLLRPRTAEGHLLPADVLAPGMGVVCDVGTQEDAFQYQDGRVEGQIRCGNSPGEGVLEFVHAGVPLGVTRDLRARAPEPLNWVGEETAVSVAYGAPGGPITAIIRPRDQRGWLVGSGLTVHVAVNGGEGCAPATYCGVGKYCASIHLGPGAHALEAILEGEATGAFWQANVPAIPDAPEAPPLDPDEEVCGSATPPPYEEDVVEPEEDVVEPEEDVVEPEEDVVEPEEDVVEPEEDVVEPEEDVVEPDIAVPDAATIDAGEDGTVILPFDVPPPPEDHQGLDDAGEDIGEVADAGLPDAAADAEVESSKPDAGIHDARAGGDVDHSREGGAKASDSGCRTSAGQPFAGWACLLSVGWWMRRRRRSANA
jgi:hypothetical protein